MPTPMKNSPSSSPRKGSMSASSWWRKVDSESSTPARKAPMAIDRPPTCISSAAPSTTSSAAAVITSRALELASTRNSGLSSQMPAATSAASAPTAMPMPIQREGAMACCAASTGAMKATMASSGTISRSSKSSTATIFWPRGAAMSPRSPSSCITMAVEVSTKPIAHTNETASGKPKAMPTPVSRMPHTTTCRLPRPKMSRRMLHRCDGRISSPITKRNITTPSSAV
ncbi:hypothetical protein D9M68_478250 [compost metagenome]